MLTALFKQCSNLAILSLYSDGSYPWRCAMKLRCAWSRGLLSPFLTLSRQRETMNALPFRRKYNTWKFWSGKASLSLMSCDSFSVENTSLERRISLFSLASCEMPFDNLPYVVFLRCASANSHAMLWCPVQPFRPMDGYKIPCFSSDLDWLENRFCK